MAITDSFMDAVKNEDIKDIRIMLKESLLVDPTSADFEKKIQYVRNNSNLDVYVEHDGRPFNDKSTWNNDYMDKLMSQLATNFSKERIDHLKEVVRYLRPMAAQSQTSSVSSNRDTHDGSQRNDQSGYQKRKEQDQRDGAYRGTKIAGGAVVGAVVGSVVAAVAGATVIGGAAIGAAVGGVAVAVVTNGEN
jgi:hypothetical protein